MRVILLMAGLALAACSRGSPDAALAGPVAPVTGKAIEGTNLKVVTLIPRSAERLGIKTAPVTETNVAGGRRTRVPFAAVLYDEHGDTWAYVNREGLAFVRHKITVDFIEGDVAILLEGPPVGALVVTVGAAELYGSETGVGGH
jgi:hypothetical protein